LLVCVWVRDIKAADDGVVAGVFSHSAAAEGDGRGDLVHVQYRDLKGALEGERGLAVVGAHDRDSVRVYQL